MKKNILLILFVINIFNVYSQEKYNLICQYSYNKKPCIDTSSYEINPENNQKELKGLLSFIGEKDTHIIVKNDSLYLISFFENNGEIMENKYNAKMNDSLIHFCDGLDCYLLYKDNIFIVFTYGDELFNIYRKNTETINISSGFVIDCYFKIYKILGKKIVICGN